ncbi:cell division protein ZapA [Neisseria arctica]|uniref:Cell division protein ZapA n=1 Tax=Neisseria arctica TaxID=1470200 RepID=A0A0J1C644_9NEIS|nr:cell division protein ZapA [Neisseria arctica]KLT73818.1 cell division protein ZapA [Neisseria arctica]UOO86995.1 cell division protein ZapA [Neisseria arctica]
MSHEQVSIHIMGRQFNIGTPPEEKATLLQAVELLNQKIDAIKQNGRIVETDKIAIMAALNVVHDLLKMSLKDDLAIGEFERKINGMVEVCDKALSRLSN